MVMEIVMGMVGWILRFGLLPIGLLKWWKRIGERNDVCGITAMTGISADPFLSTSGIAAVRQCTFAAPRGLSFA